MQHANDKANTTCHANLSVSRSVKFLLNCPRRYHSSPPMVSTVNYSIPLPPKNYRPTDDNGQTPEIKYHHPKNEKPRNILRPSHSISIPGGRPLENAGRQSVVTFSLAPETERQWQKLRLPSLRLVEGEVTRHTFPTHYHRFWAFIQHSFFQYVFHLG